MPDAISTPSQRQSGNAPLVVILLAFAQILASSLPALGIGTPIGQQSDLVRTLITPAGWTFSIWGALYFGSLAFSIYQILPAQRSNELLNGLRWPAAGAFLSNTLWATYVQIADLTFVSVVIIFFGLGSLLIAYRRLAAWPQSFTTGERWFAVLPLSALTAWLTAAAIVNVAAALRWHGVDAEPALAPLIAAAVLVAGGVIAGMALARGNGNPPFALVFLWALAGIYASGGQASSEISLAVVIGAGLTIAGLFVGLRTGGARHWLY